MKIKRSTLSGAGVGAPAQSKGAERTSQQDRILRLRSADKCAAPLRMRRECFPGPARHFLRQAGRLGLVLLLITGYCLLISACSLPGDAAPIVKIGVIAPFEGAGRPLGYAVLPAIKAAVAEANASGELGRYRVQVAAFNDDLEAAAAAEQARALALDPEVLAVIGPWSAETTAAAALILADAGVPLLAAADTPIPRPGERWGDAALADAAMRAGDDARVLLAALAADIRAHGQPTRTGAADALR